MNDKALKKKLLDSLMRLELLNDGVGPTPLRHSLSAHIVQMRMLIRGFDQKVYETEIESDL